MTTVLTHYCLDQLKAARRQAVRLISLNGGTGMLTTQASEVLGLVSITVAEGRITEIDRVVNPEKLRRSHAAANHV